MGNPLIDPFTDLLKYYIQQNNIKKRVAKVLNIEEPMNSAPDEESNQENKEGNKISEID